jgi:hypothetical protein
MLVGWLLLVAMHKAMAICERTGEGTYEAASSCPRKLLDPIVRHNALHVAAVKTLTMPSPIILESKTEA